MKNRRGAEPTTKKDRRTIVEQSLNKSAGRRGRPGRTSGQADAATTPGTSSKIIKKAIRNVIASKSQSAASPRQSIKAKKPASASGAKKAGSRSRRSGKGTKKPEAKPASKDNLDEDLDSYMMQDEGHAKNKLDADLDDYMGDAPEA
ncbi:hypothetical protein BJ085DRAFT_33040 [Dimargaris cristalligena]|uniref:Chromatin target of PRMT1 protein C-terminal domain-containing protein n=1 Tax=Dimargaris cristalligena TaxID=215637 RepID=A0A4Q0A022_9FUNG|nr:hypothetical protein BJ085DRAFT_33040 [Dimargaris cristalligena]|eukprot:RKP38761.1 hypothetical protein BJ085DRAFT_33040 [Dimargaris cristalligena]